MGKINVNWEISVAEHIKHFILQWRSSKNLRVENKIVHSKERSFTIGESKSYIFLTNIKVLLNNIFRFI